MKYKVINAQTGHCYLSTNSYETACRVAFTRIDLDVSMRAGVPVDDLTAQDYERYEEGFIGVVDTTKGNGFVSMVL